MLPDCSRSPRGDHPAPQRGFQEGDWPSGAPPRDAHPGRTFRGLSEGVACIMPATRLHLERVLLGIESHLWRCYNLD
jgi:hypothetical protein